MEYIPTAAEDVALHLRYHTAMIRGVDVGVSLPRAGAKIVVRVPAMGPASRKMTKGKEHMDAIYEVTRKDKIGAKRAAIKALKVVERELGAVETGEEVLWGGTKSGEPVFKVYLYVRRDDKCIGLLLAQRIRHAQRVAFEADSKKEEEAETLQERREKAFATLFYQDPVYVPIEDKKEDPVTAILGVSRIWVSQEYRGRGIAEEMLEAASGNFLSGVKVTETKVAFSQPTEAGMKLVKKWRTKGGRCKAVDWLMYDECDVDGV